MSEASRHDRWTIVSMAIVASAAATFLHEAVGHGGVALLRHDGVTELTSNHLSSLRDDKWVDVAGTLVNLLVGSLSLLLAQVSGDRANRRYFFWLLGALNLLPGAGYFLFSGIGGFGDWNQVIQGLPHYVALRIGMAVCGALLYYAVVVLLMRELRPFLASRADLRALSLLPYLAAGVFSVIAGAFDPLGWKLLLLSTIPAAFGGSSGLAWGPNLLQRSGLNGTLAVHRQRIWWIAALVIGLGYVAVLGPGVRL